MHNDVTCTNINEFTCWSICVFEVELNFPFTEWMQKRKSMKTLTEVAPNCSSNSGCFNIDVYIDFFKQGEKCKCSFLHFKKPHVIKHNWT